MRRGVLLIAVSSIFLAFVVSALAQSNGGYDLTWNTIDGGGATFSTGGGYELGGTAGQSDAGAMSTNGYTLTGGFWSGAMVEYKIYLPLVIRNFQAQ